MQPQSASFWKAEIPAQPVERRLVWQFGDRRGELTVFIHPGQPVPNLVDLSEKTMARITLEQTALRPERSVAPGFAFASIGKSPTTGSAVVIGPGNREIPVVESPARADSAEAQTMKARMDRANDATPPAQVAPGDYAVGMLVRKDILFFYPLAAVTTKAEVESYLEGAGSTDDLIKDLPFQS